MDYDYLKDGFMVYSWEEELFNFELYVWFLFCMENVIWWVLKVMIFGMIEFECSLVIDLMMVLLGDEVIKKDFILVGIVDVYYGGNEFWFFVYCDFNDVCLVFVLLFFIGKFGWDMDNWMWFCYIGDFCVFCIYVGKDNCFVDYLFDNVFYCFEYVVFIILDGYKEGLFCMILGYFGSMECYFFLFGIEEMMNGMN